MALTHVEREGEVIDINQLLGMTLEDLAAAAREAVVARGMAKGG